MKYLVKNKIPDLTPYVSLNYNGNISYGQISGSGLPSTIHAEEDGLYIEKNNKIWPMSHPDLSTLPSILPQRFGKLPIYEELIAADTSYVIINNSRIDSVYHSGNAYVNFTDGYRMYYTDTSNFIIFDNTSGKLYNQDYNDSHDYYVFFTDTDNHISYYGVKLNTSGGNSGLIDRIKSNTCYDLDFADMHGLYILYQITLPVNLLNNRIINRKNIIQASAFNETNYSPITIENGIVTTELNFKPDYFLVQYFGEIMDNYYYINSNSSKSLIGNFLMTDLTLKDINDVSDMSLVLGIYIGDNAVTGERLFVTAESLLNTTSYKFRASASTLPNDFQSSDFYTSTTNVAGQENKVFAGRAPFATAGTVNDVTVDWGGESNTEAWLYLINNYSLSLSDYPALEYASTHNGYLMGAGEGSLFITNHNAIWNAYTKLTGSNSTISSWQSSFFSLASIGGSGLTNLSFSSTEARSYNNSLLSDAHCVLLLITLSKKYTLYFNWITYKWCKGSGDTLTKYCTDSSYGYNGFTDDKTELDLEDDAAYVNWGPAWRMPSYVQFLELFNPNNTTTEWTTQNGVTGRKITSKTNGNSIFLPAAGYRNNSLLKSAGSNCNYWSRTLNSDNPSSASHLYFDSGNVMTRSNYRCNGQSIRPVCTDSSQGNRDYVDLGLPSGTLWATTNIGASTPEEYGLYFAWGETEGYQ